jgi:hypothetical protein
MNATFITQQQFDDIEGCVSFLADAQGKVNLFITAISPIPNSVKLAVPSSHIREAEADMGGWNAGYSDTGYRRLHQILVDALYFLDYLIPQIKAPSTPDPNGLSSTLARIPAPPGPPPASAMRPITNCLEAYDHHLRMMGMAGVCALFNRVILTATRNSFGEALPRVIDFMSMHLPLTERPNFPANQAKIARDVLTDARRHYTFGMNGMANLFVQQRRISTLILKIRRGFNLLLDLGTHRRLRADLKVIQLQATQAHRYCGEILALRRQ